MQLSLNRATSLCSEAVGWAVRKAAEDGMKIYLLMLLIGSLLTAIRFTSTPEQRSKSLPQ
jgi:hypothetical protein